MVASTRAVVLALLVVGPPGSAAAQGDGATTGLPMDFPERAAALRPTGMTTVRGSWVRRFAPDGFLWDDDEFIHADFTMQEVEVRVPIGGLLLEAVVGTTQHIHSRHRVPDRGVWLYSNAPQLGAFFIDAPDGEWRYEIGGALVAGLDESATVDDACMRVGWGCVPPMHWVDDTGAESLGWDVHRRARDAVVAVTRARAEWAPIPRLVLGAEIELPVYVFYDGGGADFFPQGAVELAYRVLGASLLGLRTRVTSQVPRYGGPSPGADHELGVTFEPFARLAFIEAGWGGFVRASVLLTIGPGYAFVSDPFDSSSGYDRGGFLGACFDIGALY